MTEKEKNKPDSYWAILHAAVAEFAERGQAGVRMEHVAKRAGYNKSLVYRFFGDKENLFREAMKSQFKSRNELLPELPDSLADVLKWWHQQNRDNPIFMKMILREALDDQGDKPVEAAFREKYYQQQIELLKSYQNKSSASDDMKPEYLFLGLLALTILPTALPQICRLVTGLEADSAEFDQDWQTFLEAMANQILHQ